MYIVHVVVQSNGYINLLLVDSNGGLKMERVHFLVQLQ